MKFNMKFNMKGIMVNDMDINVDFQLTSVGELKMIYEVLVKSGHYDINVENKFKELIKKLCDGNVNNYVLGKIFSKNKVAPITLYDNVDAKKDASTFRRSVENWESSINRSPRFITKLNSGQKDYRMQLIDVLLYLEAYNASSYDKISGFNGILEGFGVEPLYHLDFFDFCVLVAIKLEEESGATAYDVFRTLYTDKKLEQIAGSDVSGDGEFTKEIEGDFNKICNIGKISDVINKNGSFKSFTNVKSAYHFVKKYANEFGRSFGLY